MRRTVVTVGILIAAVMVVRLAATTTYFDDKVGIGTDHPSALLEVSTGAWLPAIFTRTDGGQVWLQLASVNVGTGDDYGTSNIGHMSYAHLLSLGVDSQYNTLNLDQFGNVGIGTLTANLGGATYGTVVTVAGTANNPASAGRLELVNATDAPAAGDVLGELLFESKNNAGGTVASEVRGSSVVSTLAGTGGTHGFGSALDFTTKRDNSSTHNVAMHIDQNGDVTASGNVIVGGSINAKYQDVAEWVDARGPAPAGTVMVLSTEARNVVHASNHGYDTAVAGVVSPRPGITLGEPAPGRALVAHTGRVRVKVDATYGAVHIGDLLVTSPTPGYAMRSTPLHVDGTEMHRPGTLLGKAIEPLERGKGDILVLITLQ